MNPVRKGRLFACWVREKALKTLGNLLIPTAMLRKLKKNWTMSKNSGTAYWGLSRSGLPDPSMDLLLNRWLIYQVLACRMWGRTSFYQSSGAFGFRDQLQDSMALVHCLPEVTRQHIIESSSHQFIEGDVQHWWHMPYKGVRTRITDDLLFLPFVVADYIRNTGDWSILDEETYFLDEEPLKPNEMERYSVSSVSDQKASVYQHCIRAIERAIRFGPHGLPLMGLW